MEKYKVLTFEIVKMTLKNEQKLIITFDCRDHRLIIEAKNRPKSLTYKVKILAKQV